MATKMWFLKLTIITYLCYDQDIFSLKLQLSNLNIWRKVFQKYNYKGNTNSIIGMLNRTSGNFYELRALENNILILGLIKTKKK